MSKSSLIGLTIAMTSLWVGSYFLGTVPKDSWMDFPLFMTTCAGFIGGVITCASGFEL